MLFTVAYSSYFCAVGSLNQPVFDTTPPAQSTFRVVGSPSTHLNLQNYLKKPQKSQSTLLSFALNMEKSLKRIDVLNTTLKPMAFRLLDEDIPFGCMMLPHSSEALQTSCAWSPSAEPWPSMADGIQRSKSVIFHSPMCI